MTLASKKSSCLRLAIGICIEIAAYMLSKRDSVLLKIDKSNIAGTPNPAPTFSSGRDRPRATPPLFSYLVRVPLATSSISSSQLFSLSPLWQTLISTKKLLNLRESMHQHQLQKPKCKRMFSRPGQMAASHRSQWWTMWMTTYVWMFMASPPSRILAPN
jgi:hypothetical protein